MGRVCNLVYKGFVKKNVDIFFFLNFDDIFSFVKNDQFFIWLIFIFQMLGFDYFFFVFGKSLFGLVLVEFCFCVGVNLVELNDGFNLFSKISFYLEENLCCCFVDMLVLCCY